MKHISLHTLLAVVLIGTTIVVSTIFGVQRYIFFQKEVKNSLQTRLQQTLSRLQVSVAIPAYNFSNDVVESILRSELQQNEIIGIFITEKNSGLQAFGLVKKNEKEIVADHEPPAGAMIISAKGGLEVFGQQFGFVEVYCTSKYLYQALQKKLLRLIFEGVVLVILLVLLTVVVLRRLFVRPVMELIALSREIARGNPVPEKTVSGSNELAVLSKSLYSMRDSIQEKMDELRENEDKFRSLIESSSDFVWETDSKGRFIYASPQIEKMLGYAPAEIIGKTFFELMPPDEAGRLTEKVMTSVKAGKPIVMQENVKQHKDGRRIVFETSCVPAFDADGILQGYRGVSRNITERKQMREVMIQSEKMMSVGGLAAGMAHEINNPLGIMIQAVQNIERRVSSDLPANEKSADECDTTVDKVNCYLEKRMVLTMLADIRSAGDRAAEIVANMLQFSRRSESAQVSSSVPDLIDMTIELANNDYDLKKKFDFRHIEIRREYASDLPRVRLVVTEFEQVILNLLKNAAQAMAEADMQGRKSTIIIRVRAVDDGVQVVVIDNGPGMKEEVCKRVFEPFFTTKPVGRGTGLGLFVSYMIITNTLKGSMEVKSVAGEGTTFILSLPVG